MNNLLKITKLGMMLLIGILVGQFIFITFNTGLYFKGCTAPTNIATSPPIAPTPRVEPEVIERGVEDWLDRPARL